MLLPEQLEFVLAFTAREKPPGRDAELEKVARDLLAATGASSLGEKISVVRSGRLRSAAGRAEFPAGRILLNRRLAQHGDAEIHRTLRHELAHLLAHFRAGRRRIAPHGDEWRRACADLGIAGEARCHNLPFPIRTRARKHLYVCPSCRRDFPRARRIRRAVACLVCCRTFNGGRFDARFRLRLRDADAR